jgi:peptidoglycan/LPS O-acetylase OafA/YrhL
MKYRADIDGLRSIAVLSVIIYHAGFNIGEHNLMRGGFLGVDIFFVISGFLITSLLITEFKDTGYLSLTNFYERRVRRLLPALILVSLASVPFAWRLLLPEQLIDYSKSIISSLLFCSNFYWNFTLQEYGAESALLKPFLHTWSLAVEEQYYILYPLLLIACYRRSRVLANVLLAVGLLVSLLFADHMTHKDLSFSFYMLPSRFWELLAGGLLANALHQHPEMFRSRLLQQSMPALGLLLILHALFLQDLHFDHPGYITLIPVLGTMLIIGFGSKDDMVSRVLSSRLFVGVGLISYSLYLWHYPIFAFGFIDNELPSSGEKSLWILITILLSVFSYFLVEKPFRNRKRLSRRRLFSIVGAFALAVLLINVVIINEDGFPSRLPAIVSNIQTDISKSRLCLTKSVGCDYNTQGENSIYLVGDSQLVALEKPLLDLALHEDYAFHTLDRFGCTYIRNMNRVSKRTSKVKMGCSKEFQELRRKVLLSAEPSTVILGGRLPLMLSEERFNNTEGGDEGVMRDFLQYPDNSLTSKQQRKAAIFKEYKDTVLELADHGHKVILVYPIPEVGWNVPKKLRNLIKRDQKSRKTLTGVLSNEPVTTSYSVYKQRTKDTFALLDGIEHENIIRFYPHELFCNTTIPDRCITHDLSNSYYRDDVHLSDAGGELVVDAMKPILLAEGKQGSDPSSY